jgi:hypothetical protein
VKNKIVWLLLLALILIVGYLALLSDEPVDDSEKFVNIGTYLFKQEMIDDIDTLITTFEHIHPNPYRFNDRDHFFTSIDSIKENLTDSITTIEFWRLIDQIIGHYNDAHSYAHDSYVLTDYVKKGGLFFPLSAKIYNEQIMVTKDESYEQILPEGAKIISINGQSAQEIISKLTSHSMKETRSLDLLEVSDDFGFYLWKAYDWDFDFTIHYLQNSNSKNIDSITVKGIKWEQRKSNTRKDNISFKFTFLDDNIGYMKITDFNGTQSEINHFYVNSFNKLREKESGYLILDFRGHRGGADSYGEDLAQYIAEKPFRKLSKAYWKITPEFKESFDKRFIPRGIRWFKPIYLVNEYSKVFYGIEPTVTVTVNYELKIPYPEEERFQGEVFLITDHNTFSAGSIFAEMFKHFDMGTVVGQPTGNLYSFNGFALVESTLPNSKLTFQISSVYNVANNGEEGLKSVQPDYFIDSSEDPLNYILHNLIE